jgi:quercetin dioxygenase-like cupin family protein
MPDPATPTRHRFDDLEKDRPMPGLWRGRVIGQKSMISQVFLEKGTLVPTHSHANEQFCIVLSGRLRFDLAAGRQTVVSAGEVLHIPPDAPHAAEALEDSLVYDIFSPPSATTGIDRH